VSKTDHHSAYLAKAIEALTPGGHTRVDELLDQLADVVGDHEAVATSPPLEGRKPIAAGWRALPASASDLRSADRSWTF
jgi:hypothetical protein